MVLVYASYALFFYKASRFNIPDSGVFFWEKPSSSAYEAFNFFFFITLIRGRETFPKCNGAHFFLAAVFVVRQAEWLFFFLRPVPRLSCCVKALVLSMNYLGHYFLSRGSVLEFWLTFLAHYFTVVKSTPQLCLLVLYLCSLPVSYNVTFSVLTKTLLGVFLSSMYIRQYM